MRLLVGAWTLSAISLAICSRADAQVDESLVTRRWKTENFWAETYDKPLVTDRSTLEDSRDTIRIFHWNSEGRIKLSRTELDPPVWIGYRALTVSISSSDERLDHDFADVGIAVAVRLGSIGDWSVIASAGGGTANDGRWDNPHALYPVATLDFARSVPSTMEWHVGLTLDGNRSLFPEIPLPYAMMEVSPDPLLNLCLGFPRSEVLFRPFQPLLISLRWEFPTHAQARADVDFGSGFSLFVDVTRRIDGFHLRDHERTRLFYEINTAEVGVRWATSWINVSISVGYAFGQRFFTGSDLSHRTAADSVDDMPFVAITLTGTFWAMTF